MWGRRLQCWYWSQQAIDGMSATGGTNIYPALETAFKRLAPVTSAKKHVILLSDGQSPYTCVEALARQLYVAFWQCRSDS